MNKYFLCALLFSYFINADRFQSKRAEFQLFPLMGRENVKESSSDTTGEAILKVKYSKDFAITGDGSTTNWNNTEWVDLPLRGDKQVVYKTKIKMLYSDSGIYCLYYCEDKKIRATLKGDFLDFWNEDVVEAFFWTDETVPLYFEYELSPLNHELPILVPNIKGKFFGWRPWHYDGNRRTKHATHIIKDRNMVTAWTAEFFIPYTLLTPMTNVPPKNGSRWRANFYRIDHDMGEATWQLNEVRDENFHDYEKFAAIVFE